MKILLFLATARNSFLMVQCAMVTPKAKRYINLRCWFEQNWKNSRGRLAEKGQ